MGQYYKIVNLTKKQFISPWSFGDGAKLMEFGNSSSGVMTGLAILLADGNGRGGGDIEESDIVGSWAGDQIVITGDYADQGKFTDNANENLYNYSDENFKDISSEVIEALCKDHYVAEELVNRTNWMKDTRSDAINRAAKKVKK